MQLSHTMEQQLLTIALLGQYETQRTLTALGRRGLARRGPQRDKYDRFQHKPAELTPAGWMIVAEIAHKQFEYVVQNAQDCKINPMRFRRAAIMIDDIDRMNQWAALELRAKWNTTKKLFKGQTT